MTPTPYDYSIEHIQTLLTVIEYKHMFYPASFKSCPLVDLQRCYNGIGPEAWSSKYRKLITGLLNCLEAPALIHDYEYSILPKTYWNFTLANIRLIINACKDRIPKVGLIAGILCQLFGYKGYKHAKII